MGRGDARGIPLHAEGSSSHYSRRAIAALRGADRTFCDAAGTLGSKLAMLLFQLPPSFKKDMSVLDRFLGSLPPGAHAAFEFRHASWHDSEVFECLRQRGQSLCVADSERLTTPVEITAPWGYFRLRDEGYGPDDIETWAETIRTSTRECREVFIYFKHEEQGKGPELARALIDTLTGHEAGH